MAEPEPDLRITPDASRDEAAAIAAAIGVHLRSRRTSASGDEAGPAGGWNGPWQLAARLASRRVTARELPSTMAGDAWAIAGRLERSVGRR